MSDTSSKVGVCVKKVISVLPNDYPSLENLPSINGVLLLGDMTTEQLNLLSGKEVDYTPITLGEISEEEPRYLVLIGGEKHNKISVEEFINQTRNIQTVEKLDETAAIGSIQFVITKKE